MAGLKKEMRFIDLTMASLGAIIGSGWLFGALYASQVAGPAAILSWVVGGVAVMLIGLVYAELGGLLPESGSVARYPHYSHGSLLGFLMGWAAWIAYASVPAVEAEAVVQYASHYIPAWWNRHLGIIQGWGVLVAALLLVAFFFVNYYGVRLFSRINTWVTALKFVMPVATIVAFLASGLHWDSLTSHGFAPAGTAGVLQAIATSGIIFSYLGFRQAVDLAGEAEHPQRDVPRAVITAIGLGIILYVILQLVFTAAVPARLLAGGWPRVALNAPFAQLAASLNLGWLALLLYADAVLSPAGTGNIYIASTTRVIYAMSQNRYYPRFLAKVDRQTGVPRASLVVALILGLIFLLPFPSWSSLVTVVSSATVFTYIVGPVAAVVFRREVPEASRPFRLGGIRIIAPIAFVIASLIIYWTGWQTDWKLLVALLIGVALYLVASRIVPDQVKPPDVRGLTAGLWMVVYLLAMLGISYFGSARFGAPFHHHSGLIHYPGDLIVVIVIALVAFYWGVASGYRTPDLVEALDMKNQPAHHA